MVEKKKKTRSTSSSVDPATQYALDVTTGKILAGPDTVALAEIVNPSVMFSVTRQSGFSTP